MKTLTIRLNMSFILVLACMVLIACNSTSSTKEGSDKKGKVSTENKGGDLKVAIDAQPPTLDTHLPVSTAVTKEVSRHVLETLVTVDSDYQVVPMLAESFEQSEDGLTYTFHLRKGVTFHNGKEMKAEDVVASMQRWLDGSTRAKNAIGTGTFTEEDDYTVVFQLDTPAFGVLDVFAATNQFAAIMPKEIIESAPADGVTEIVGTGPFEFVEWKQDQYIQLKKFDDYLPVDSPSNGLSEKKEALVDNIYFEIVTDGATRLAGLTTGQYHLAYGLSYDNYEQIVNTPGLSPLVNMYGTESIVFNKKEGALTNPKMRQAINYAINKEEILLGTFANEKFYRLDPGLMMKEQVKWYTDAGKEYYNVQNIKKAKELLKEAGYNGEEIKIITTRDYDYMYNTAVMLKEQLGQVGLNVKLDVLEWGTLIEKVFEPAGWEIFIMGYSPVSIPTQISTLDKSGPGWPEDEKLNKLLSDIRYAKTQKEATDLLAEAQEYNWSEYLSSIKLGDFYTLSAHSDDVQGADYFEGIILWNTSLEK